MVPPRLQLRNSLRKGSGGPNVLLRRLLQRMSEQIRECIVSVVKYQSIVKDSYGRQKERDDNVQVEEEYIKQISRRAI